LNKVTEFEQAFASYVGAKFCIALTNGTVTLEAALVALGVKRGDRVAVPPLTMSATTLAVLRVGAVPVFEDVDPETWLMGAAPGGTMVDMPVSLYGLHAGFHACPTVDDAAQTLRPHGWGDFTSYSFQKSKILSLGEGGMLATDDEDLARRVRWYTSLGYDLPPDSSKIDPEKIKASDYARHIPLIPDAVPVNARMNELTAEAGLSMLEDDGFGNTRADQCKMIRDVSANRYREAIQGCEWLTPQHVPEGWTHDYWTYAIATDTPEQQKQLSDSVVRHGGERPYSAWRLTYQEPAFEHLWPLAPGGGPLSLARRKSLCPVAESLQPRLLQFQTNNLESAERNAGALRKAIKELNG
jgi:perosamine synthetase